MRRKPLEQDALQHRRPKTCALQDPIQILKNRYGILNNFIDFIGL